MRTDINQNEKSILLLLNLIEERTGHVYKNGNQSILLEKISPLVEEKGFDSYLDYYYLLRYGEEVESEWRKLETVLAVNETYFWREYDQIRAAVEIIIPQLQERNPGRKVRIWHAACATGEEAYSMAISLVQAGLYLAGPIEIIATDFNMDAIALARSAIYRRSSFRAIPDSILRQYFSPFGSDRYRLDDSIRSLIQFHHLNLLDQSAMRLMENFDLIFCRNAFIYFSPEAIRQVAESFYRSLRAPGYLFTAAVESLLRVTASFELNEIGGAFVYVKEETSC